MTKGVSSPITVHTDSIRAPLIKYRLVISIGKVSITSIVSPIPSILGGYNYNRSWLTMKELERKLPHFLQTVSYGSNVECWILSDLNVRKPFAASLRPSVSIATAPWPTISLLITVLLTTTIQRAWIMEKVSKKLKRLWNWLNNLRISSLNGRETWLKLKYTASVGPYALSPLRNSTKTMPMQCGLCTSGLVETMQTLPPSLEKPWWCWLHGNYGPSLPMWGLQLWKQKSWWLC